jgi:hypothetical protein
MQFTALNRFEQQAIASAIGVSVEEAQRLFNISDEQYELDAMKQKELQELAAETQEIGQELKAAFMALAVDLRPLIDDVVKPLIKGFSNFARIVGDTTNAFGQFIKVGLFAAGLAALIAAPFTGGASLIMFAKIAGMAAIVGTGVGMAAGPAGGKNTGAITPGYKPTRRPGSSITGVVSQQRATASHQSSRLADSLDTLNKNMESSRSGAGEQKVVVQIGEQKFAEATMGAINRSGLGPFQRT